MGVGVYKNKTSLAGSSGFSLVPPSPSNTHTQCTHTRTHLDHVHEEDALCIALLTHAHTIQGLCMSHGILCSDVPFLYHPATTQATAMPNKQDQEHKSKR